MLPLIKAYLHWKTKPATVKKALFARDFPEAPPRPGKERIKVASAQLELIKARNLGEYVDWLYYPLFEAQKRGAQLFLFPEYVTLPLLGLLPAVGEQDGGDLDPGEIFRFVSPFFTRVYKQVFSELARKAGIYIAGGSMLTVEDGNLFNQAHLYNPEGETLLKQKKMNLVPLESKWGVQPGSDLNVVEISGGWRLAMPVCMDATYFEVFRLAGASGADLVLVPIADINPDYSEHMALRGIWARVQEEPVYGIKSALVGDFFGFKFTGKAGIYAPGEITPDGEGVISEGKIPHQGDLVFAELSRSSLEEIKSKSISFPGNSYYNYLEKTYDNLTE